MGGTAHVAECRTRHRGKVVREDERPSGADDRAGLGRPEALEAAGRQLGWVAGPADPGWNRSTGS